MAIPTPPNASELLKYTLKIKLIKWKQEKQKERNSQT